MPPGDFPSLAPRERSLGYDKRKDASHPDGSSRSLHATVVIASFSASPEGFSASRSSRDRFARGMRAGTQSESFRDHHALLANEGWARDKSGRSGSGG